MLMVMISMLASEEALAGGWNAKKEDEAWKGL
jgi:hypothetical protein